jgi:hypothetical protein
MGRPLAASLRRRAVVGVATRHLTRWLAMASCLVLAGVLTACPEQAAPARLILIGHDDHVATAAGLLVAGGLQPLVTTTLAPRDVVLFVVAAPDGPMPQTRTQVEAIRGQPHGPAAILLVRVALVDDHELLQLVVLETRELLAVNEQPSAATMPVLRDDDPNLTLAVRGLLAPP